MKSNLLELPLKWRQQGPLKRRQQITIEHAVTPEHYRPYHFTYLDILSIVTLL